MFEWDPRKAKANAEKYGVTFDDAVTVFLDANALMAPTYRIRGPKRAFDAWAARPKERS